MRGDIVGLVVLVVVLALITLYLSQTASRLDRLHHRIDTSRAILQGQFQDRANQVLALATSGRIDPASTVLLADAADAALIESRISGEQFDPARCAAESALTRSLEVALSDDGVLQEIKEQPGGPQTLADLGAAAQKAAWSRRFHNDAVRACLALRKQRLVRLFRLAGSAPLPRTVELDDEVPAAFRSR